MNRRFESRAESWPKYLCLIICFAFQVKNDSKEDIDRYRASKGLAGMEVKLWRKLSESRKNQTWRARRILNLASNWRGKPTTTKIWLSSEMVIPKSTFSYPKRENYKKCFPFIFQGPTARSTKRSTKPMDTLSPWRKFEFIYRKTAVCRRPRSGKSRCSNKWISTSILT